MKHNAIAIGILLSLTIVASGWAADQSRPLDALAPYVGGEWRIEGAWKDGSPLKAREVFEWCLQKKFIVCRTYVTTPQGEYQRYETIFGEQDGKLMAWGFVFDGHVDVSQFNADGKKLSSAKSMPAADGNPGSTLHQSIELIEPNKFRWVVGMETDGKMKELMDGIWIRSESPMESRPVVWPESADQSNLPAVLSQLIGTWNINAKWSDGRPVIARQKLDWGVGKKFITWTTTVLKSDGTVDYERYYTLFGMKDGKPTAFHFIYDGNVDFAPQEVNGNRIGSVRTFKREGGELKVNQFIELIDPNTLHWKVWNDQDGETKPMMDANWIRVSSATK